MMTINAECRQVRERMDSYISGELTVESNHDVLRHLEQCQGCRSELERRERMGALLIEGFDAAPDATALTSRIERTLDLEQYRWGRVARYGAVAAALIAIVSATVWWSRPVDAAAFDDSVDDHIACALGYPPPPAFDRARAARNLEPAYQAIVDAVAHQVGDYHLIDAHMCPYQNRNYAHLIYRGGGKLVSVFAEPATRGRLPLRHDSPRKGLVSAGASTGDHHVFVVSDGHERPPDMVINALLRSTLAFTRTLAQ